MACEHIEQDAPPTQFLVGSRDVAQSIRSLLLLHNVEHKPGEVLALEFVVSTSRAFFEGVDRREKLARTTSMISCTMRAFRSRFQIEGQIVSVALHLDERTPHLHVVVVPLVREPDLRRKDKNPTVRLSAKRIVGGRGDMSREQTRFASFFADLGLERGVERSSARHVPNRVHEAMLEKARQDAINEAARLATSRRALEAERAAQAQERARIQVERDAVAAAAKEAAALKARAIRRAKALAQMLQLAEELRRDVLAAPSRGPALDPVRRSAGQLEAARQTATANDEWLAQALALRSGRGGTGR